MQKKTSHLRGLFYDLIMLALAYRLHLTRIEPMDHKNIYAIDAKLPQLSEKYGNKVTWLKSKLEFFITTKEPAEFYFYKDKDELDALLELLGLDGNISGSLISLIRAYGTIDGDEQLNTNPKIVRTVTINELLGNLPDIRSMFEDNLNDFSVSVGVCIDDDSLLVLTWTQEEYYLACDLCVDDGYPCEHKGEDGYHYDSKYWAILLDPKDVSKINWDDGVVADW